MDYIELAYFTDYIIFTKQYIVYSERTSKWWTKKEQPKTNWLIENFPCGRMIDYEISYQNSTKRMTNDFNWLIEF